jgi:signal transduction histidine kinase
LFADTWQTHGAPRALQWLAEVNASTDRIHLRWLALGKAADPDHRLRLDELQIASLLQGESISVKAPGPHGKPFLFRYVPIQIEHQTPGVMELSESLVAVHTYTRQTVLRTLGLGVVLVTLSGCLLLIIGMALIGTPMRRIIEKTRRVGAGDLQGPIHFGTHDEFAEVAVALNQMCEQLQASQATAHAEMVARIEALEQLRHADRLKTVGRLASGLAHELGTPLNVVLGRANLISSGRLAPDGISDSARIIKEQVQRMAAIIRQVLDFARRKSLARIAVDLQVLARQTLDMLTPLAQQQRAILTLETDAAPVRTQVEPAQIEQVLVNLVTNAWQAMPQGGQIEIGVHSKVVKPPPGLHLPTTRYACLTVTDEGKGIPDENLPQIFDPFFTTKDIGQGTGLGLSIAYGIVQDHGGWIEAANRLGKGACLTVYLPLEEASCLDAS